MAIYCERCQNEVHPLSSYCFYCGAVAPAKTVFGNFTETQYENGIYCPACGKQAPEDGAFCGGCGDSLFTKPSGASVYCPSCCEKNSSGSVSCIGCKLVFNEWYKMRGLAAQKMGFQGNLSVKEKMTEITYHLISDKESSEIILGRSSENDIVIPCNWVSSNHLRLDIKNRKLIDNQSSNCTYINRSSDPVSVAEFYSINEFNVAGSFTFPVIKKENVFAFRLMAILDEEDCNSNGDPEAYEKLRKQYFILLSGDQNIYIRKQDGYMENEINPKHEYYIIRYENGFYYYSDPGRDIEDRLLFSKKANWPVNWTVEKTGVIRHN